MSIKPAIQATLPELIIPDAVPVPAGGTQSLHAVGRAALNNGLKVFVQAWTGMAIGDVVGVFWDDSGVPFASVTVDASNQQRTLGLDLPEALFTDGSFRPWYQVVRFSGTAPLESQKRDILVKTTLPGGRDPDPTSPVHDGLFAPAVPHEVATGGVSEEIAVRGVDVTVPAWSNMTAFDRLDLSWGGERLSYTVQPGEERQSVVIHVDQATILAAGDGKILLVYQVIDAAANRSEGWSKSTTVDVFAAAAVLNAPKIVEARDGSLDADALAGAGATVSIVTSDAWLHQGDPLTLTWRGTDAAGTVVEHTETRTVAESPPDVELLTIPGAVVTASVGGQAVVSYSVLTSQGTLASKRTLVQVTGTVRDLPAPAVIEAESDVLDAGLTLAHAVITPWPGMVEGDLVTLRWDGTQKNGEPYSHVEEKIITSNSTGHDVTFTVSGDHITALDGGTLDLFWLLYGAVSRRAGGARAARESAHLKLRVGTAQQQLPAPSVAPLKEGAIEPSQPSVTVTVPASAGTQKGDVVWLWWSQDDSAAVQLDHIPVSSATEGRPLPFEVDSTNYAHAARVGLYYTRVRGGTTLASRALALEVGAGDIQLPAPTAAPLKEGNIDPAQPVLVATVPSGVTLKGDVVHLWWSQDGAGHGDIGYIPVTASTEGRALPFDVEPVNYRDAKQVNLYYTIMRAGRTQQSAALGLKVSTASAVLPAPSVPEATGGVLDGSLQAATISVSGLVAGEAVSGLFGDTILAAVESDGHGSADIPVTAQAIAAAAGREIRVHYAVVRNGAGVLSEPLVLTVSEGVRQLPAPSVPEAVNGIIANPDQGVHIVVPAGTLRAGDRVRGVTGSSRTAEVSATGSGALSVTVPASQLAALTGQGGLAWGYEVAVNGTWQVSATLSISVVAETGPWTEDFNTVPLGSISPGSVLQLAHMHMKCISTTSVYPQCVQRTEGDHYLTSIFPDITFLSPMKAVTFQAAALPGQITTAIFFTIEGQVLVSIDVMDDTRYVTYITDHKPIGRLMFYNKNLAVLDNFTLTPWPSAASSE